MKVLLTSLFVFATIHGASALRFMSYNDYMSMDSKLPHCNSGLFKGAYGYKSAKCGCRDHEKKTNGKFLYRKQFASWEVPYYTAICKGQQFDEGMENDESVGYGHNPWGPEGQYNGGRGVNSYSFNNPQGGIRGNSFSQNFDEEMEYDGRRSLRAGKCPKNLECTFSRAGGFCSCFSVRDREIILVEPTKNKKSS